MPRHKRRQRGRVVIQPQVAAEFGVKIPKDDDTVRYLSPNDIGRMLNVTGEAVKQWIYGRKLPAVKISNGYWKVRVSDIEEFLKVRNGEIKRFVLTNAQSPEIQQSIEELGHVQSLADNA